MSKPFLSTIFALVLLSGVSCSTILNNLPGVYSIDVQQGNIIDQSMIDQLRPNMTKRQVLYIMGSPMLNDPFHQSRWDYLYSKQPGGEARQQKKITLLFEGDNIIGIQGDFKPSALPVIKQSEETTVDVPKRELEKTLWEMITGLFDFEDEAEAEVVEAETKADEIKNKETGLKPDDEL